MTVHTRYRLARKMFVARAKKRKRTQQITRFSDPRLFRLCIEAGNVFNF